MNEETTKRAGPDLANGIALSTVDDGTMLLGHDPVVFATT